MKIELNLTKRQLERFNELLFKGLCYDDEYYPDSVSKADDKIYYKFGEAIEEQTPYKQYINGEIIKHE